MPGIFSSDGLRFAYPDNWVAEQDESDSADVAATVTSPNTAFWTVMYYRGEQEVQPLANAVLEALQSEYPQLEVDEVAELEDGCGYDLSFSYVDLLNTASIRAFHHQGATYLVLCQTEDHELEVVEPVFAAMTASLRQEPNF